MSERGRLAFVAALTAGAAAAVFIFLPPIPQPQWYHDFADRRAFFGIPNFLDIASNAPFLVVAAFALWQLARGRIAFIAPAERWPYVFFFLGVGLTAFTSAWYHWQPGNERLPWDRLTMTVAFMGWFAAQLAERIGPRAGLAWLPLLLVAGPAAVIHWAATEAAGAGDLRAYGLVHFYPALLIPLLVWLFPPRYSRGGDVLLVLGLYALALAAEWFDRAIFALTGFVSGHTLKHLIAAFAVWRVLVMLRRRQPLAEVSYGR